MSNIIEYAPFYLKKDKSELDFFNVSDLFQSRFLSKQKGFVTRQLLKNESMWVDLVTWETLEDANNAINEFIKSPEALNYMSFIDDEEKHCDILHFSVEKEYK